MGIFISDLDETFWNEIKESYLTNKNTSTIMEFLKSDHKNQGLIDSLEDKWLQSYQEERFKLWEDLIYHRTKHSMVITWVNKNI